MNWDMLAAVAELAGAAAVVASLLYLAQQTRASASAARSATTQAMLEASTSQLTELANNSELTELYMRGISNPDTLDHTEQGRLHAFLMASTRYWAEEYHASRSGDLPGWAGHQLAAARRDIISSPGFRRFFEVRRDWVDPEFRSALESEIQIAAAEAREYRPAGLPPV